MPKKILERLGVELSADRAKLGRDFNQAIGDTNSFANKARKILGGALVIGGVGLVTRELKQLFAEQGKLIDQQAKFADVIGLSTEKLAGYRLGASITGVELGQLQTGVTRLLKNLGDAGDGLAAPTRALEKLGLTFDDLKDLDTDQQIKLIADRFTSLDSTIDKSSVTLNLFGRSGVALGKLLETGSKGIERFQQEAEELGIAINRIDAAKVEEANDAITRAQVLGESLSQQIVVALSPAITGLANDLIEAAKEAGGLSQLVADAFETIEDAAIVVAAVLAGRIGGALAANAVSFTAARIEAIRYQATLARMAGVSRTAALGMGAATVAANTLRGAMTLLGGPFGVIIAAASAVTLFGSSADDSALSTDMLKERINELTSSAKELRAARFDETIELTKKKIEELQERQKGLIDGTESLSTKVIGLGDKFDRLAVARFQDLYDERDREALSETNKEIKELTASLDVLVKKRDEILKGGKDEDKKPAGAIDISSIEQELKLEEEAFRRGAQITQSVLTPQEKHKDQVKELKILLADNAIGQETYNRKLAEYDKQLAAAVGTTRSFVDVQSLINSSFSPQEQALIDVRDAMFDLDLAMEDFPEKAAEIQQAMLRLQAQESELVEEIKKGGKEFNAFADEAARNIQDTLGGAIADAIKGTEDWEKTFLNSLANIAAQLVAADLSSKLNIGGLLGGGSSGGGNTGSILGSIFGGFFADGGRPNPHKVSVLGEDGPELFVPDGIAGTVIPNSQISNMNNNETNVRIGSLNFPNVTNAREAKVAGGAAAREMTRILQSSQRYN